MEQEDNAVVSSGVYESAVKGRSYFREAYREVRQEAKELRDFVAWVDTWVSNPIGSYSYPALAGLFSQAKEKIAILTHGSGPSEPLQCLRCGTVDAFGPVSKEKK